VSFVTGVYTGFCTADVEVRPKPPAGSSTPAGSPAAPKGASPKPKRGFLSTRFAMIVFPPCGQTILGGYDGWQFSQVQDTHDSRGNPAGSGFNIIDAATQGPVVTFGYLKSAEADKARNRIVGRVGKRSTEQELS
jgi:hypothetical protein